MSEKEKAWYEVTRSISQLDGDQLRSIADDVPGNLEDCTLLLVRVGNEPVREYVHGDGEGIRKAGDLAGFSISPLPGNGEPELPEGISRSAHSLVPWRARLNSKATMEKMRTDSAGIRKSVEALMPADSYVSVTLRRQGYFEQARIRIGLPTSIPPSRTATNLSQHTRSARESPQHAPTAAGTQNSHNGLDRPCSRCSPT